MLSVRYPTPLYGAIARGETASPMLLSEKREEGHLVFTKAFPSLLEG
jgi:hypothetical protein